MGKNIYLHVCVCVCVDDDVLQNGVTLQQKAAAWTEEVDATRQPEAHRPSTLDNIVSSEESVSISVTHPSNWIIYARFGATVTYETSTTPKICSCVGYNPVFGVENWVNLFKVYFGKFKIENRLKV